MERVDMKHSDRYGGAVGETIRKHLRQSYFVLHMAADRQPVESKEKEEIKADFRA